VIRDLDFSPDSRFLVSCSYDGTMRIWRIRDGFSKLGTSFSSCVKFNPDGGYIAAGNRDGKLMIWNVRTSRLVEKWTAHGSIVRSVAFTLDGKGLLVSSGADYTWKYWDISSIELAEPGYGTTKGSVAGQKGKVAAHTVCHSHVPVQRFLLTQAPLSCPSAYRTMSVPFPFLLMVNGLFLAQVILLCVSGTCAMPPCSAH